jgi:SpoIID/LytB domain protein
MALETAVASTVAAEAPPDAASAMLEAQAIVTRSYFAAGRGRHRDFDFCDTTHCQFLRDPPPEDSPAARAARATAGRVLTFHGHPFAAFYSARCGGLLAPLPSASVGTDEYPYYAVRCEYCLRHPLEAKVKGRTVPRPHHHGMCQMGAADMAKQGRTAQEILAHYYPGAEIER